jgi:hypothetical protein
MIFSQNVRTDTSPRNYTESTFAHLDRSARPACGRIRAQICDWCNQVPDSERREFVQRIRSSDDLLFHSAFLELYTHQLLLATRHSVVFHPELAGTSKRPDFLATDSDGREFFIECTVATEDSSTDRAAQARLNTLYESISQVTCNDIFLSLRVIGTPSTPVPGARWKRRIQSWVDSLNYEALVAMGPVPNDSHLPKIELEHDGLHLTIKPIPKKPECRGKGQRAIGVQAFEGCMVTSHNKIRETIRDKAGRYGTLTLPYIVVVNCLGELTDEEEIHGAMFGHSGIWRDPDKPAHTRVSAVLAIHHLLPWSVAVAAARLFHNPYATLPYSGVLATLPQTTYNSEAEGVHPREVMRIDSNWPHE